MNAESTREIGESKMEWKETRRKEHHARSDDEQIGYIVAPKRNGKYYIKAYLSGGTEHRLPYQDFDTADEAKTWVEEYERKRAERNAQYADEKPLKWW